MRAFSKPAQRRLAALGVVFQQPAKGARLRDHEQPAFFTSLFMKPSIPV
jgi:hypothetical protein